MRQLGQRCRKIAVRPALRMTETGEDKDDDVSVNKHFNQNLAPITTAIDQKTLQASIGQEF
jgi:hypothetical protein